MDSVPPPCPKCGGPRYHDGHAPRCKACRNAAKHQYNLAHPDKNRARATKWHQENRERALQRGKEAYARLSDDQRAKMNAYSFVYRQDNRDACNARVRDWERRHPDNKLATKHRRRARENGNGGSFTAEEWHDLKARYDYHCLCCGKCEPEIKLTADHVIPVRSGGPSLIGNIQPLCLRCNQRKGSRRTTDYREIWPR